MISWNCGIGRLKRNLYFNTEYRGIWHDFTEMLFSCGRGTYVWGKLHEGKQIWVAQQAPSTGWAPSSKQCKHGKVAVQLCLHKKNKKKNNWETPLGIDRYGVFRADADTNFFSSALADDRYGPPIFLSRYYFCFLNLHHNNYTMMTTNVTSLNFKNRNIYWN